MADPDDPVAREAVATALGTPSCVVGCDPAVIDNLLSEIWPEERRTAPQVLVCAHASPIADRVLALAQSIGELLNGQVSHFVPIAGSPVSCDALPQSVDQAIYDLLVWGEPEQSLGQQIFSGPVYPRAVERICTSLLVTRAPRWPLKRLLLIVRGDEADDAAVDWAVRLARPSQATVTVLTIVPPIPAMYNRLACIPQGLDALLTTDTVLGRQLRGVARRLVEWEVEGTLRLRQGIPDHEMYREVAQGDYDLLVLAGPAGAGWRRWLKGDWADLLLQWADRPVLLAKPKIS